MKGSLSNDPFILVPPNFVRLNNVVRTITGNRKFDHVSPLFEQLKLRKLHDIYQLELGKFAYQLNWNKLSINYLIALY